MKKHPFITVACSAALVLAAALTLHPGVAQEYQLKSSGKIEMPIDPNMEGFDLGKIERSIRDSAKSMRLDASQQANLEENLKGLRESVKNHKGGKPFTWKWEYPADGAPENSDKPKPRSQRQRVNPQDQPRALEEELRKMFEGGQGTDPAKLMEEMMRKFGMQPGQNGQRQFEFRFGPNGLEKGNGDSEDQPQNSLEGLRRMMGQKDRGYNPDTAPRDSKYSRYTLAEYRSSVKNARPSTVSVLKNGEQVALGAVITQDGYAITKASELGKGAIECGLMDGRYITAKVVDRLEAYDLALLKMEGNDFTPLVWSEAEIPVGTMLAASGIDENPISVGVLSVQARNLDESNKGFAGLALGENPEGEGVLIMKVVPGKPGDKAGMGDMDVVLAIDGVKVNHSHELMKIIASKGPGDIVKFNIKTSAGEVKEVSVTLASRAEMAQLGGVDPTAQMGTDLSNRPGGFPSALQNDLGINANQCGGPVVDIDGNAVGLNIARSGRTSTLMLSGKLVKSLLSQVGTGKLVVVKDSATLDKELRKAEAAFQAAQEALNGAKEARAKAEK